MTLSRIFVYTVRDDLDSPDASSAEQTVEARDIAEAAKKAHLCWGDSVESIRRKDPK